MRKEASLRYSNGEVTVVWTPSRCVHSGICARGLPAVFKPRERPWVDVAGATSEEIVQQVSRCPSGALAIERNGPSSDGEETK